MNGIALSLSLTSITHTRYIMDEYEESCCLGPCGVRVCQFLPTVYNDPYGGISNLQIVLMVLGSQWTVVASIHLKFASCLQVRKSCIVIGFNFSCICSNRPRQPILKASGEIMLADSLRVLRAKSTLSTMHLQLSRPSTKSWFLHPSCT